MEDKKQATIRLKNLAIGYKAKNNTKVVASGLCTEINSGELTCLLGANGVGKSTLLRTLSAFQPKLEGEIDIMDREIGTYSDKELSRTIGVVLTEKCDVRNMMARELIEMGRSPYTGFWGTLHGEDREIVEETITRLTENPLGDKLDELLKSYVLKLLENSSAMIEQLNRDLARENDVDFILGTDPDSDRVGIMIRDHSGEYRPVTGNQTGVLLLDYLIGAMRRSGKMPEKPVALKTIVTTEMARKVAESNGVTCYDTFTGFKFMAEKKNALEAAGEGKVIFSYEESYGYMLGDYVRDKDAVTASMLLTEMAAWYAAQGMTLFDALEKLYEKYGHYAEKTYNLVMPGLDGLKDMAQLMKNLRENPPAEISGVKVVTRKDYTDGSVVDCATGAKSAMELSGSNVLRFELADGTTILVRPSGTEPKIKVYILTQGADSAACDANLEKYGQWVKTLQK